MIIADIDIFSAKPYFLKYWTFKETQPINPAFNNGTVTDSNYLLNSASFTPMLLIILSFNLFKWCINKIFIRLLYKYKKNEIIMRIGQWGYDKDYA